MTNYVQGNLLRVTATFENNSNVLADPTIITFRFKNPAGTTTEYVYGTNAELVKESVGVYHVDVSLNSHGIWFYRFSGTGAVTAASQDSVNVVASVP